MNRKWAPWLLGMALLATTSRMLADGVMLNGVSPRSIGRGGTNLAHADNGALLFDNPAAAVNIEGTGLLDVGADLLITDFNSSNPRNAFALDTTATPLPQVSLVQKSCDGVWAYGIGLFVPAGFTETYDMEGPFPLAGSRRYKSFGALGKVLPGVACRVTERLSAGATLGVGISHAELEGPYFLQSPGPLQGTPTLLDVQGTGAALVWSVGLQYLLTDATTLGIAYQSESHFHLDGSTRVEVPFLGQSRFDSQVDVTWPRSLGVGVRHELCPHRILSVDAIWFDWSSAFDNFGLQLNNPTNVFFPEIREQFPLDWRDTVSIRAGYEHVLCNDRTLRFGYVFHRNPIPNGTLTPYIQAIVEHGFSVGYGWTWWGCELDLSYMFTFGPKERVGTSDFVGGDFDQSVHDAETHAIALSLIWRTGR
jgi:long-subunit fatty acid transport protein